MKIINQTADEMTLTHPSSARSIIGIVIVLLGGALFVVASLVQTEKFFVALAAFICFAIGLAIVFVNADVTITLHKPSGKAHHHQKTLTGKQRTSYELEDASHVEIVSTGKKHPDVFIVFRDGSRVPVDYAYRSADDSANEKSIAHRVAQFLDVPIKNASA